MQVQVLSPAPGVRSFERTPFVFTGLELSNSCHLQRGGRSFERPPLVLYTAGIPPALLPKALQPGLAVCGPVPGGVGLLLGGKDAVGHPLHLAEDPLPKSRALAQGVRWTSSPLRTTWAVTLPPVRISSFILSSSSPPAGGLLFWNCTRERKACQDWGTARFFKKKSSLTLLSCFAPKRISLWFPGPFQPLFIYATPKFQHTLPRFPILGFRRMRTNSPLRA